MEINFVIKDIVKVFLIVMLICVLWDDVRDVALEVLFILIIFFNEFILFMVKRYFVKNFEEGGFIDEEFVSL